MQTKSILTLIPDIYSLVGGQNALSDLVTSGMGTDIANAIQRSLGPQEKRGLRLSGLGPSCDKALWHSIHESYLAEPFRPEVKIKFVFGHILEHLLIGLAKAAGHEVTGEQDELCVDGVTGHRDCIIDGAIVDVKSSSTLSFPKFRDKTLAESDGFGYLDQLDAYILGSQSDELVHIKDRGYILAVDKQLGHLALYEHKLREMHIRKRIESHKKIIALDVSPRCTCGTVDDGSSGNVKLDVQASYSSYKHVCFPHLRTFLYEGGPRFLTKVVRRPMRRDQRTPIPEVDKHGKYVYH